MGGDIKINCHKGLTEYCEKDLLARGVVKKTPGNWNPCSGPGNPTCLWHQDCPTCQLCWPPMNIGTSVCSNDACCHQDCSGHGQCIDSGDYIFRCLCDKG